MCIRVVIGCTVIGPVKVAIAAADADKEQVIFRKELLLANSIEEIVHEFEQKLRAALHALKSVNYHDQPMAATVPLGTLPMHLVTAPKSIIPG